MGELRYTTIFLAQLSNWVNQPSLVESDNWLPQSDNFQKSLVQFLIYHKLDVSITILDLLHFQL